MAIHFAIGRERELGKKNKIGGRHVLRQFLSDATTQFFRRRLLTGPVYDVRDQPFVARSIFANYHNGVGNTPVDS